MFRFLFLIISILPSTIFAHVIVFEKNPKPSVEVNLSVLQEFTEICNKKKKTTITPKVIKQEKVVKLDKPLVKEQDKNKDTKISNQISPNLQKEIKLKQETMDRRLAEIEQKEALLKALQEKKVELPKADTQDPKLSRAKNLLKKVEKNLLKTRAKNKEYTIDSEVKKINLSNISSKRTELYSAEYESLNKNQKFIIKFPKNVNDIKPTMHQELNRLASILTANQDKRVRIVGYSSGDTKSNDLQSKRRNALEKVVAVRKYLVDRGVNTRQVSLQAATDSETTNSDNSNRVEIMEIGL